MGPYLGDVKAGTIAYKIAALAVHLAVDPLPGAPHDRDGALSKARFGMTNLTYPSILLPQGRFTMKLSIQLEVHPFLLFVRPKALLHEDFT